MHLRALLAAVLVLSTATARAQQPAAKVDPSLEATHRKFTEVFNKLDAKGVASFFAEDATLINPMGRVAHGPAEVEKVFQEDAARVFKGTTSTFTITGSRQLSPEYVWLDLRHEVQNAQRPDGTKGTIENHVIVLAQKKGGDWKWLEVRPYAFIPKDHATGMGGAKGTAGQKAK